MPREPIPEDLRRFLLTSVPSVPFVEALLLLREANGEPIDTTQIARRLYMPEHAAGAVLEQLAAARIVERLPQGPPAYRFAPAPELAAVVEQLATFYRSHLVEVTDVIHSRTARKAHQFADAFRLRKDS
ncbi:MAG TPA: hypothetical protein VFV90_00435 [Usitatibacter sp.]|nr:hypothetical protein [Usitatibacter sp.]